MIKENEYTIKLDQFEGPMDLLLYLIRKEEMEIEDISISQITGQYLKYLDIMKELNIIVASEYLSMAATLLRLKARTVIPRDDEEAREDPEEEIVNREQLIQQLLEYKKYKEAASSLRDYESEQFGSFTRGRQEEVEPGSAENEPVSDKKVTIFDLISAFQNVLERAEDDSGSEERTISRDDVKLDDRIEHVLIFLEDRGEVEFTELFCNDMRKIVLVVSFMALLELVKMNRILFRQEMTFEKIYVRINENYDRKKE